MSQISYMIVEQLLKQRNHIRGLAEILNTNPMTIARKVKELAKENIIDYRTEGRNQVYAIKNSLECQQYLKIIENNKLINIIGKYSLLRQIIEKIQNIKQIRLAILFGSYAKGNQDTGSDIDLYIETENKDVKKQLELIDTKLSIKIGKFNKETPLAKEIIKNHVIIKGIDRYYEFIYKKNS